jgi:hypothetical protein
LWPSILRKCFSVSSQAEATQRSTMSASRQRVTLSVLRATTGASAVTNLQLQMGHLRRGFPARDTLVAVRGL